MTVVTKTPATRARARWLWIALPMLVLALAYLGAWRYERINTAEHDVLFVVPRGTAYLQAVGQDNVMLPRSIRLVIGELDTLVIRNEDGFPIRVGPFKLESEQTYRQRFRTPGVYRLVCTTLYHEEQVEVIVVGSQKVLPRLLNALVRE
jgi:hypothetical protein